MSDRALLVTHAVLGFAALVAATSQSAHALLAAVGRPPTRALVRFSSAAPFAVIAQTICGLAIYPAYRIRVRAADFDLHAPGLSALFDFKEHLAALGLALVVGAALAGRRDDGARWPLAAISCTGAAFLWTAAVIGIFVTARHPL